MKSKAFTLAETLITLGVIGIVAALTLPAIIQKQHKKELETAFIAKYDRGGSNIGIISE
mgnify:CR=1 FL=1